MTKKFGRWPCPTEGCGEWITSNALGRASHLRACRKRTPRERQERQRKKAIDAATKIDVLRSN
ncbi:hypothetical protein LCGC14_1382010 [marine sediment metagenome]|uniref:C2H2-type domain-containing protein n=1 Tax=marine sediment metagenome TaxID=412755 RepID=A0A0F9N418_9ZZZZ